MAFPSQFDHWNMEGAVGSLVQVVSDLTRDSMVIHLSSDGLRYYRRRSENRPSFPGLLVLQRSVVGETLKLD